MSSELWAAATRHPFLMAVRDATIERAAFDRWLVQDALFVADLLVFQERLLARAPREARGILADGCLGLAAELDWFDLLATQRGLVLGVARLPATEAYADLLGELDAAPAEAALTALWAIEQVYLDGWTAASSAEAAFAEFTQHWTTPEFQRYVLALAGLALPEQYGEVVDQVLRHEIAFWEMALQPSPTVGAGRPRASGQTAVHEKL